MSTTESPSTDTSGFVAQLYSALPIGAVVCIIFICLRRYLSKIEVRRDKGNDLQIPPINSETWFYWIWQVWTMDTQTFYNYAGLDALIFNLWLRTCIKICAISLPIGFIILLPVFATGGNGIDDDMSSMSLSNVRTMSDRNWSACVGMWLFVGTTLYQLTQLYLKVAYISNAAALGRTDFGGRTLDRIRWRNYDIRYNSSAAYSVGVDASGPQNKFARILTGPMEEDDQKGDMGDSLASAAAGGKLSASQDISKLPLLMSTKNAWQFAIMIRDLPRVFWAPSEQSDQSLLSQLDGKYLFQFFQDLFPGQIARVLIMPDMDGLCKLDEKLQKPLQALEKIAADNPDIDIEDKSAVVMGKKHCFGKCGGEINILEYHRETRDELIAEYTELEKQLIRTPTAFVQFKSMKAAATCLSTPIRFGSSELLIEKAERHNDINWANLKFTTNKLVSFDMLVNVLMVLLVLFWSIPASAIQGLANLRELFLKADIDLTDYIPGGFVSWLEGFLSVVLLNIWMTLVPIIVNILTGLQKKATLGEHHISNMGKYYDCLVFMLLLVTAISGSILSNLSTLGWDFNALLKLLAEGLSEMSIFFMAYIMFLAVVTVPMQLLRIGYWVVRVLLGTEDNTWGNHWQDWANTLIVFTITLTYSAICPLMWIIALFYFGMFYTIFSYQAVMCFIPENNFGGCNMWPRAYTRLTFGIYIAILTMFILLLLKKAIGPAVVVLVLLVIVWLVKSNLVTAFDRMFQYTDIRGAHIVDKHLMSAKVEIEENDAYVPPIFKKGYGQSFEKDVVVDAEISQIVKDMNENAENNAERSESGDGGKPRGSEAQPHVELIMDDEEPRQGTSSATGLIQEDK